VPDRGVEIESSTNRDGLLPIRFGLNEWLGALGDLGTFVPLFLSLVALNGLPPARTLLLVGLVYIGTALFFRLPVPVQPLKAMAAIAMAGGLGMPMIAAAGLWIGVILFLLAVTGKIDWLSRYFTRPVVKGIQLGVGLILLRTSLNLLTTASYPGNSGTMGGTSAFPEASSFLPALWLMVIPQLSVTLGNAVYAVSDVAKDYFGKRADRMSHRNLAISLGLSNLAIGSLGGLPVCHGSGGLTAHYRFGARTGGATIIMGAIYILLGIVFVFSGDLFLAHIPPQLLGAMLLYIGICQALLIRGLEERLWIALGMAGIGFLTRNLAYGLLFGLVMEHAVLRILQFRR
jgi:SulP family sulfate permease